MELANCLSKEFDVGINSINNVINLFESGGTIPFIARYRKEATGGLDEVVLRNINDRYAYLLELTDRKATIIKTIDQQGKLTENLKEKIEICMEKTTLEDLYLPYKPKRKTKATQAKERGLGPLLMWVLQNKGNEGPLSKEAEKYVDREKEVHNAEDALKGAADIYAEMIAEKAENRDYVRKVLFEKGVFVAKVRKDFQDKKTKYCMYYDYRVPVKTVSSHNMLALRRAEKEGVILFDIEVDNEEILHELCKRETSVYQGETAKFLTEAIHDGYARLIKPTLTAEVRLEKKKGADIEAILNFEENLRNLLLSSPAGHVPVLAIDPGFRSGCKVAALNDRGDFMEFHAIYPHPPQKKEEEAKEILLRLLESHSPAFIAIGNGTASRETERFVRKILKEFSAEHKPKALLVSESGASVYSASTSAIKEFPDLDITVRGAISIGRRLMDPLAELVKLDPKSIGVGQYQHDVDQKLLKKKLSEVVESCVNFVGVDLNSASIELLAYVSGINSQIALNIRKQIMETGFFTNRNKLLDVPRLGKKAFEQAAGFLRIKGGDNALDDSSVHPESYHIVQNISQHHDIPISELIGNSEILNGIDPKLFVNEKTGTFTVKDILEELKKPGRDPRSSFTYANFNEEINSIDELKKDMALEGVVTNVTNFGAFVDIGVHQDGLVHISQMANKFVRAPVDIVKVGQNVKVKVLSVDLELKRISLTMK